VTKPKRRRLVPEVSRRKSLGQPVSGRKGKKAEEAEWAAKSGPVEVRKQEEENDGGSDQVD